MNATPRFELNPADEPDPVLTPNPDWMDDYAPTASPALVQAATAYIGVAEWRWARTYSERAPHWYASRRRAKETGLQDGHESLFRLVRDSHQDKWAFGRSWRTVSLRGLELWIFDDGAVVNAVSGGAGVWYQPRLYPRTPGLS